MYDQNANWTRSKNPPNIRFMGMAGSVAGSEMVKSDLPKWEGSHKKKNVQHKCFFDVVYILYRIMGMAFCLAPHPCTAITCHTSPFHTLEASVRVNGTDDTILLFYHGMFAFHIRLSRMCWATETRCTVHFIEPISFPIFYVMRRNPR